MTRTLARPAIGQGPIDLPAATALEADEVLELLASGRDGLGAKEVARRLAELGPNVLRTHGVRLLAILASQLRSYLLLLLLSAAAVSAVVGERADALIIFSIVGLSVGLGSSMSTARSGPSRRYTRESAGRCSSPATSSRFAWRTSCRPTSSARDGRPRVRRVDPDRRVRAGSEANRSCRGRNVSARARIARLHGPSCATGAAAASSSPRAGGPHSVGSRSDSASATSRRTSSPACRSTRGCWYSLPAFWRARSSRSTSYSAGRSSSRCSSPSRSLPPPPPARASARASPAVARAARAPPCLGLDARGTPLKRAAAHRLGPLTGTSTCGLRLFRNASGDLHDARRRARGHASWAIGAERRCRATKEAMMATKATPIDRAAAANLVFGRVLVGVDRSEASIEAARQAAVLAGPDAPLTLLAAWTIPPPIVAAAGPAFGELDVEPYRRNAEAAIEAGKAAAAGRDVTEEKVVRGTGWAQLIDEIEGAEDALVAVGSHGIGRMRGIVMGSTATELVHKAPCSVLVARTADDGFPRRVVVGVDGSPESALAFAAAGYVAERFGAALWPVVAHGGEGVDKERVEAIIGYRHEDLPDEPVSALVAASADADLVVVGSRGLHGLKALGSVSERVAHEARCSTLIVRRP